MKKILMTGICLLSAFNPPMGKCVAEQNTPAQAPLTTMTLQSIPQATPQAIPQSISKPVYEMKCAKIYPEAIKQGETAFISVKSKEHLKNPYYIYGDKKLPLYQDNDSTYSGMLGTNPSTEAGKTKIILSDETKALCDTLNLEVKRADFGVQNVKFSKSVFELKATEDERAKIVKALNTKSDTAYFEKMPYNRPTVGTTTSIYGKRRFNNGIDTQLFHNGIDIAAPKGRAIRTMQPGKVLVAEQFNLNGGTVIVDHGRGLTTAYLHMSDIGVKVGQMLKPSEVIGKVGSTGHSSGPHLHFGVYINGTAVNPETWLKPSHKSLKNCTAKLQSQTKNALKSAVKKAR